MPYIKGKRVSNEEWTATFGSIKLMRTGPNGENPGDAPELDEESGAPKSKAKKSSKEAGGKRSPRSAKAAKAAIADALGVTESSPQLADIDVSGLDAPAAAKEDDADGAA